MTLGLLPAIRGGLGDLARTGQHTRLLQGYVRRYLRAFDAVRYFSYLRETLGAYTTDAEILALVRAGKVRAVVGEVVGFDQLPAAMTRMRDRKTTGRVIVRLD